MRPSRLLAVSLLAALALIAVAPEQSLAGKRKVTKSIVSFHLEAARGDSPKKTTRIVIDTDTFRVRLAPVFDQTDLVGYFPFLAEDGLTMGAAFKLNPKAAKELAALSQSAAGSKLFTVAGIDPIHYVVFNAPVEDGYIVCWKGLKLEHLDALKAAGIPQLEPEREGAGGGGSEDPAYVPELGGR